MLLDEQAPIDALDKVSYNWEIQQAIAVLA